MSTDPRQAELHELQRQYRNMEINRRAYAEESQSLLRKQQGTIDKLRKDNDGLKSDIAMIMRSSNKPMSQSQLENLQKMQDAGDRYANSIDFERKNIQTMEEQIQIMKQKVLAQRKAMGGVNASKDNHHMIQKQIRILENRLEKALVKFNEAIAHNKDLRHEIDDLRSVLCSRTFTARWSASCRTESDKWPKLSNYPTRVMSSATHTRWKWRRLSRPTVRSKMNSRSR